ncbi:MAG: Vitamin B12 transporter BtuB, partial [Nitrospiraceae bacterium]
MATVRIRGANAAHTLVLIDGAIVNSPTSGEFNFANLTAENVERIEILRGAQSMLWGSDAIGGVINIITKRGTGKPTASA